MLNPRIRSSRVAQSWMPWTSDDGSRVEWLIAIARAALSSSALLIVWLESTDPAIYAPRVQSQLAAYAVFAALVLVGLTLVRRTPHWVPVALLVGDLSFALMLTLLTRGPASPFLAFFLFAILSAACRWGARETLVTTAVVAAAIGVDTILVGTTTPVSLGVFEGEFDAGRPIVGLVYVVIVGPLLAALAGNEQQRRKEVSTIASLLEHAGNATAMEGTLEAVLNVVRRAFAADRALLVLAQTSTSRVFLWDAAPASDGDDPSVSSSALDDTQRVSYEFEMPGAIWHASRFRASDWFDVVALDASGGRVPTTACTLPAAFVSAYQCRSAMGISVGFGTEWSGRLLLINPQVGADRQGALRLAHRLGRQIGPAAHHGYLLGTLRARAANAERARLARELHDGIVQSLIVAEIHVEVVRRRSVTDAPQLSDALQHIQTLLRDEIGNLRELTHRLKAPEPGAPPSARIPDLVARFEQDTGIQARLVSDGQTTALPARSHVDAARILQEGLVNVRKHSGARHVLVRAAADNGRLRLSIEDDGRGFPFSGRLSHAELSASHQGPAVIMERVRELGGEITIESRPGRGARIDVALPLHP